MPQPNFTQKELITEIREEQKVMASKQLQLSADFSNFMNKQDAFNQKITDLLETNPLTKRKGVVEDLEDLKVRTEKIETSRKVTAGKVAIGITILTFIGGLALKLFSLLDKH